MSGDAWPTSVVLPVYNGAGTLAEAIASVQRQVPACLEVIVVDDGSTDETPAVAASFGDGVRYVRQENRGPAAARNAGIGVSRGEFIAFIDADDVWSDGHTEVLCRPFERDAGLAVVLGQVQQFRLKRSGTGGSAFQPWKEPQFCFHLGAALVRRTAFERIGGFDETLRTSDDLDWFLRAREHGLSITMVPETVYCYRLHAANLTSDTAEAARLAARAIKMSLDRRRSRFGVSPPLPRIPGMPPSSRGDST